MKPKAIVNANEVMQSLDRRALVLGLLCIALDPDRSA